MNPQIIAERLKRARSARGLTQAQAAEEAEIPTGTLQKWETAVNDPPSVALARLAGVYRVTADYLLGIAALPAGHRPGSWLVDSDRISIVQTAEDIHDLRFAVAQHLEWFPWAVEVTPSAQVASETEMARLASEVNTAIAALRDRSPAARRLLDRWGQLDGEWTRALRKKGLWVPDEDGV